MVKESEIVFEDSGCRWAHNILPAVKEFIDDDFNYKIHRLADAIHVTRKGRLLHLSYYRLPRKLMSITKNEITVQHCKGTEKLAVKIAKEFNIPKIVRDYW